LKYARALRRSAFIIAPLGRAGLPVTVHELLASFVEAVECSPQFLLEPARPIAIPAAAGIMLKCRWMDSPIGAGTISARI
jgi:hypothetical protein